VHTPFVPTAAQWMDISLATDWQSRTVSLDFKSGDTAMQIRVPVANLTPNSLCFELQLWSLNKSSPSLYVDQIRIEQDRSRIIRA
jgi:hypothetical protein